MAEPEANEGNRGWARPVVMEHGAMTNSIDELVTRMAASEPGLSMAFRAEHGVLG